MTTVKASAAATSKPARAVVRLATRLTTQLNTAVIRGKITAAELTALADHASKIKAMAPEV